MQEIDETLTGAGVFAKPYKKVAQIAPSLVRYRLQAFTLQTKIGRT